MTQPVRIGTYEYEIQWGDCDPAGIVFYPRYFVLFEVATGKLFEEALGMKQHGWCAKYDVIGIPMVDTGARFLVPSTYGDVVRIETRMLACRRSSFDIEHRLFKAGTLAVEAHETRVWTGRDFQNPDKIVGRTMPDEMVAAFGVSRSPSPTRR